MYNDRFDRTRNQLAPRAPFGRSCPAMASAENRTPSDTPMLDERIGNRNCDGSPRSNAGVGQGGCGWGLTDHPLAMVYSPCQLFRDIYAPDAALKRGTMFAELDLPFEGDKRRSGGIC